MLVPTVPKAIPARQEAIYDLTAGGAVGLAVGAAQAALEALRAVESQRVGDGIRVGCPQRFGAVGERVHAAGTDHVGGQ
jgi:hypothetical protein